jgi:hypothetical protein
MITVGGGSVSIEGSTKRRNPKLPVLNYLKA